MEEIVQSGIKANGKLSTLHLLPCHIDYDGVARVDDYFIVKKSEKEQNHHLEAQFRGHLLLGKQVELPDNIKGYNLQKISKNGSNEYGVSDSFKSIHVWAHHEPPSTSQIQDSLNWFNIADAVHS